MSHDLSDEEWGRLQDAIARALRGDLVSRHSPAAAHRLPSRLERLTGGYDYWPSWLPPPGSEPHPGVLRVPSGDSSLDEPGTYEVEDEPGGL